MLDIINKSDYDKEEIKKRGTVMNKSDFKASLVFIDEDEKGFYIIKNKREKEADINSYALLENSDFHNGIIKVKMYSTFTDNAPDYARGFIGIVFRVDADTFESFYVRPANGFYQTDDPVRQMHAVQYFSYPKYTFQYFRDHHITEYENKADIQMKKWIELKAVIKDEKAIFYIDDMEHSVLTVDKLLAGNKRGKIGLFVDIGTKGYYKDLEIILDD